MTEKRWMQYATRTALGGVLSLVVLTVFAQGAARAEDDDPNSFWNIDRKIMDSVARGFGLKSLNDTDIEYRERSPLVVPPSRNLPPPEVEGSGRTAAWPVDPDQKRRQAVSTKKKGNGVVPSYDDDNMLRTLSPSELNTGSTASASRTPTRSSNGSVDDDSPLTPSQLGYRGGLFSWKSLWGGQQDEYGTFTREPPRSSLTAPPTGYQTPSATQPYGVAKEKVKPTVTPRDWSAGDTSGGMSR